MFKKKPSIPPRPKPPSNDMLVEDLRSGPDDTVLFDLSKNSSGSSLKDARPICEDLSPVHTNETMDPEIAFQQVKAFVEVNRNLKDILVKLQTQNEQLQTTNLELREKAEEIRKKVLCALK